MPFSFDVNRQPSPLDNLPNALLQEIASSLQGAIEIDIPESHAKLDWEMHNGEGHFVWNQIGTRLLRNCNLRTFRSKSGGWEMVFAYHQETEFLLGFMREKRFAALQAQQPSRRRMHYLDALARTFNGEQNIAQPQLCLFSKQFEDEEQIGERVRKLMKEFNSDVACLSYFALVLFDTHGDQLFSLRLVLVNPALEIVAEVKLNSLLSHEVSPIVETVPTPETPAQNPGRNLNLKTKAQQRKKNGLRKKPPKESDDSEDPEA